MDNQITFNYYPFGKTKALTMSFDDGRVFDRRLVKMFNEYGIKGTFHINTSRLGQEGFIKAEELRDLYDGHEVSLHTHTHPTLAYMPKQQILYEITKNKSILETLTKQVICGMSYPNGSFGSNVTEQLKATGVLYSRTTLSTGKFALPDDFLLWHPTIHYLRGTAAWSPNVQYDPALLMKKAKEFAERPEWLNDLPLMQVWGHSYELEDNNSWNEMEEFCGYISGCNTIWFAQNIQVVDYVIAVRGLRVSTECDVAYNPSAVDVWIGVNNQPVHIPAGKTVALSGQ